MILPKKGSRYQIVNLLSEFILSKIPTNHTSVIEIVDCKNFFIIKGTTTYDVVFNLSEIIDEFKKQYEDIIPSETIFKTIDLLEYSTKITFVGPRLINLYKSTNPMFSFEQLNLLTNENKSSDHTDHIIELNEDSNFIISQFPYGFSLNCGKSIFHYLTEVAKLSLNINHSKKISMVVDEVLNPSKYVIQSDQSHPKTIIIDDFDVELYSEKMKKVDLIQNILNPLSMYN